MSFNYILRLVNLKSFQSTINFKNSNFEKFLISCYQENYKKAMENLISYEDEGKLNENDKIVIDLLKIATIIHINCSPDILDRINNFMNQLKPEYDKIIFIYLSILSAQILMEIDEVDTLQKRIKIIKRKIDSKKIRSRYPKMLINDLISNVEYIKAIYFKKSEKFDEAIKSYQNCIDLRLKSNNYNEIALSTYSIGVIYKYKENYESALEYLTKALNLYRALKINSQIFSNEDRVFKLYNNIGYSYWKLGELDKALKSFENALNLKLVIDDNLKSGILINIGLLHWEKGDLDNSLQYYEKSLEILEEKKNNQFYSKVLNNIGNIYLNKGELDLTFQYYNKSIAIAKKIDDNNQIATNLNNIGEAYQAKGEFKMSYDNYYKSLELFNDLNLKIEESYTLFNLINVSVIIDDETTTNSLLSRLEGIKNNNENKIKVINQTYNLSSAIIKKSSLRFKELGEAHKIFNDIINDEIIKHEYKVEAILQLCELLLAELKFSGKPSVLKEVTELINKLYIIAKNQNSFLLLGHSYMLLSKIALLNLNLDEARQLLILGQKTAEEKGFNHLAKMMSIELESQESIISKIYAVDKDSLTLDYLLELTEIENFVSRIIKNKALLSPIKIEEEIPSLLLIIGNSGIPIFSHSFEDVVKYDVTLIGGFLTAINSFLKEALASTGQLERIKHKEYTLLFDPKQDVIFCYMFKGSLHSAILKFKKFNNKVQKSKEIWTEIKNAIEFGKILSHNKFIEDLINQIFIK